MLPVGVLTAANSDSSSLEQTFHNPEDAILSLSQVIPHKIWQMFSIRNQNSIFRTTQHILLFQIPFISSLQDMEQFSSFAAVHVNSGICELYQDIWIPM